MLVSQFGEIIRERRKELKITQSQLAELAQVSINTIYKFEKGQVGVTLNVLSKLAEILGLELLLEVKKQS